MPTKLRIVAAILLVASVAPLHADDERDRDRHRHHPRPEAPRLEALYQGAGYDKGLVAVANPHAAEAGAKILEHGGNAIDAAVAIAYALNVVEPQSAGIGGGGFMLIHLADGQRTFAIDSRERAPAGATPGMFGTLNFTQASTSGISVGVPGMVRGTAMAVQRHGKLPLRRVLQPAIELADRGFAATPRFVSSPNCASAASRARVYPETAAYFCPGGAPIPVGAVVTNKPLAETLRTIARHGPEAFYTGEIAHAIVEGQKRASAGGQPGTMTMADLAAYEATRRAPVSGTYRGWTIKGMDSPSSGGLAVMQMLEMIERFPIGDAGAGFGFGSANTLNVMAEAMRTAFADRAVWMGDADFSYVPAKGLLHPTYTALRSGPIAPTARMSPNPVAGDPRSYDTVALRRDATLLAQAEPSFAGPGGSTTHFVVGDRWGNLVSYTNTIESGYGAGMFAGYYPPGCADVSCFKSYGFLLNNELTDFNFVPSANPFTGKPATNDVAPGKRPRSSMAPTMIFDARGRPVAAYGSPGGSTIINSVLNVTLNVIDHGMTIQQAIDAPRLSVTAAGGAIAIDVGNPAAPTPFDPAVLTALRTLGHTVNAPADIGSVQFVAIDPRTGRLYGGADARREGTVIGVGKPGRD
ncbi:MAG: gamma-glutamyltransferase [Rubrivivax sp.]|nr:gamma-glutamyltransferase [Rubrivivax sp.]